MQFDRESDQDIASRGDAYVSECLAELYEGLDPAYAFIMLRFNRTGISHPSLPAVCYVDEDGIPTLGMNYRMLLGLHKYAVIGLIQHIVGHYMSGHVGNRFGRELREYCIRKHGQQAGTKLFYKIVEMVADAHVSLPEYLEEAGFTVTTPESIGLGRWAHTLQVLKVLEKQQGEGGGQDDSSNQPEASGQAGGSGAASEGDGDGDSDGNAQPAEGDGNSGDLSMETGGASTKDVLNETSKSAEMLGENQIQDIMRKAMENTSFPDRGFDKGDFKELIAQKDAQPVLPWFNLMQHHISAALSEERRPTMRRQNRRNRKIKTWPGYVARGTTWAVWIVDTSGSMGSNDLSRVSAQMEYLAQQVDELHIIHCDAEVVKAEEYRRGLPLEEYFGRGGTTFAPALKYVRDTLVPEHMNVWPNIVAYFTDGYGEKLNDDDPIIAPWETKMVWVLTPAGFSEKQFRDRITRHGEVIKVDQW